MNSVDAAHAVLAWAAEDMFTASPDTLTPPPDPRLAEAGWTVRGYLNAADTVRGLGERLYYGFVAEWCAIPGDPTPGEFVVVVRGTQRFVEWVIDAEFALVSINGGGQVEDGFHSVYRSMALAGDTHDLPAANAVAELCAGAASITVVGHSLGAAIATYLALDLAQSQRTPVAARLFASPRAGDEAFARRFDAAVTDCHAFAYEPDLVPRLPLEVLGYASLGGLATLPHSVQVPDDPLHNHHASTYAWLLDPEVAIAAGGVDYILPLSPSRPSGQ